MFVIGCMNFRSGGRMQHRGGVGRTFFCGLIENVPRERVEPIVCSRWKNSGETLNGRLAVVTFNAITTSVLKSHHIVTYTMVIHKIASEKMNRIDERREKKKKWLCCRGRTTSAVDAATVGLSIVEDKRLITVPRFWWIFLAGKIERGFLFLLFFLHTMTPTLTTIKKFKKRRQNNKKIKPTPNYTYLT